MLYRKCRLLLLCLLFVSCNSPSLAADFKRGALQWQGIQRTYTYYIPENLDLSEPQPLMLVLHGLGADGNYAAENWGFTEIAQQQGHIAVFPDGLDGEWNDGRGKSFFFREHYEVDDVGFLSALITQFVESFGADATRVFMVGVSNGGMMTLRMGCEKSSQLTAIAPLLASLPKPLYKTCLPDKPLPVMMINGTKDDVIPFEGGAVMIAGERYGEVVSVHATLSIWQQRNACNISPVVAPMDEYKPNREAKGITSELYAKCGSGKAIQLYHIEDGAHSIPSFKHKRSVFKDVPLHPFNAAGDIWDFFKRYKK